MILYFTGTGNSAYVAKRIAKARGEEALDLFQKIRDCDVTELISNTPWIVVTPTYAWRIPRILERWLARTPLAGNKDIYFVMTCGGEIGNAGAYLRPLCAKKGLNYRGCFPIVMPENYIAMFSTPAKEEALAIIERAEGEIEKAIALIDSGEPFPEPQISFKDRMNSGIVNEIFYPLFVHAKKFYATDSCVSCGLCECVCPLRNIRLVDGRPQWADHCTHCMACINRCPRAAIEYGKHSRGLLRYTCPK